MVWEWLFYSAIIKDKVIYICLKSLINKILYRFYPMGPNDSGNSLNVGSRHSDNTLGSVAWVGRGGYHVGTITGAYE